MAESGKGKKGCALAVILVAAGVGMLFFCGIISAIAIPNLLNAIDRGKQKRTMADIRSLGVALENYRTDNMFYPSATSIAHLTLELEPIYIRTAPRLDGWSRDLIAMSSTTGYTICSGGKDGGACTVVNGGGATAAFNDSIIFVDGQFVQWPEGQQR